MINGLTSTPWGEIKRKRAAKGWTQKYLAQPLDRTPRSIMYIENRGRHSSLNTFYRSSPCWIFPQTFLSGQANRPERLPKAYNDIIEALKLKSSHLLSLG